MAMGPTTRIRAEGRRLARGAAGIALVMALAGCGGSGALSDLTSGIMADGAPTPATSAVDAADASAPPEASGAAATATAPGTSTNAQTDTEAGAETVAETAAASSNSPSLFASLLPTTGAASGPIAPETWTASGSVATVYGNLALGLNRCHLGFGRDLGKTHMLFAETPPGKGTATAVIHVRTAENRPGLRAFSFAINGFASSATVTTENHRLPAALVRRLRQGARLWTAGTFTCPDDPTAATAQAGAAATAAD